VLAECGPSTHDNDAAVTRIGKRRRRRRWDCRPEIATTAAMDPTHPMDTHDSNNISSLATTIQALDARSCTAPLLALPAQPQESTTGQRSASSCSGTTAEQGTDKENDSSTGSLLPAHHRRRRDCIADSDDWVMAVPSASSATTGTMMSSGADTCIPAYSLSLVPSSRPTAKSNGLPTSSDEVEQGAGVNLLACFDSDEDDPTLL
jgi:hypothetical protein